MKLIAILGLVFSLGVLAGYTLFRFKLSHSSPGTLRIDRSDPDGPYLFLELHESPARFTTKKYVSFLVDIKDHSQV